MKVNTRDRRALLAVALVVESARALVACSSGDPSGDPVDFPNGGAAGEAGRSQADGGAGASGAAAGTGGTAVGGAGGNAGESGGGNVQPGGGADAGTGATGDPNGTSGAGAGGADGGAAGSSGGTAGGGATSSCSEPRPSTGCPAPHVLATLEKPWGIAVDSTHVYFTTLEREGKLVRVPITGGAPEILSSSEIYPHELTVAGGYALFGATDSGTGHVVRVPIAGGPRAELLEGTPPGIVRVSSNGDDVFYVTNSNVINKVPILGGAPVQLAGGPFRSEIADMVLFDDQLYVANDGAWNSNYTHKEPATAKIERVPTSGDPPSTLVPQLDYPQFEIAADLNNVFYSDGTAIHRTAPEGGDPTWSVPLTALKPGESPIQDMISDGDYLYFADAHALHRLSVTGGTPETMTRGWLDIRRLAVDAGHVYFTDNAGGTVVQVAKDTLAGDETPGAGDAGAGGAGGAPNGDGGSGGSGGAPAGCDGELCPEPIPLAQVPSPWGLATDATHVYFTSDADGGNVWRVPISSGEPESIAGNQIGASYLARAGGDLFWCLDDGSRGQVVRGTIDGDPVDPVAMGIAAGVRYVSSDGIFAFYATVYNVVMRAPIGGGSPAPIAQGPYNSNVMDMVLYDGELYFTNDGVWNNGHTAKFPKTAAIKKVHVSGAARATSLVWGLDYPQFEIAVDESHVYWNDAAFIHRTGHGGGGSVPIVPLVIDRDSALPLVDLVSDGVDLYFANEHTVYTAPVTGGRPRLLASGMQRIRALAVDAENVYFTDQQAGVVSKLAK